MRVQELMLVDTRMWDVEQLGTLLLSNDIRRVLKITLSRPCAVDGLMWQHERSGNHTMKSRYNRATSLVFYRSLEVEERRNLLWGLKVPPRVRNCLWRIGRECLPHKVNLFLKKVVEDNVAHN